MEEFQSPVSHNYKNWSSVTATLLENNGTVRLTQSNLSTTATLGTEEVAAVERWPLWGGRGVI